MKHILFTGCSYGQQIKAFIQLRNNGYFKDTMFYNLQGSSLGSRYQLFSAVYGVEKLQKNGVDKKDIYVVCQWSNPFRVTTIYDINQYQKLSYEIIDRDFEKWKLDQKSGLYSIGLGNYGFINVSNQLSTIYTYNEDKVFKKFLLDNVSNVSPEDRMIQYHFDIHNLQNYLKVNKINYNFLFFHSALTGFNFDRMDSFLNGFSIKNVQDINGVEKIKEGENELFKLPNIWKESIIYSQKKWVWLKDLIDWERFVLYENDRISYGGIDEFMLETVGSIAYLSYKQKPVAFGDHLNEYGDFRYVVDSGLLEIINKEFLKDESLNVSEIKKISVDNYKKLIEKK